jgi:hypothetical protein
MLKLFPSDALAQVTLFDTFICDSGNIFATGIRFRLLTRPADVWFGQVLQW